ncbi:TBC1 domain family member 24-like [Alosa sapidissima]|uniref:TBC1 domain family member 24-like n=1 Tax=Alosa sapidissima TaxID=34773 RepID=UPI001C09625C|nr:TBC1 domain family member 24-like [Alosa sapidissima]
MISVSSRSDFASLAPDTSSLLSSRRRSHSLQEEEEPKHDSQQTRPVTRVGRPRSRSFYSFETSEDNKEENITWCNALSPKTRSLLQNDVGKNADSTTKPARKRSKANPNKDLNGSRGNLKSVPMMTITEPDNWEISAGSGMKYGQYVEWEKIDPEAAVRYGQMLASSHHELKSMGRTGFWALPHTLRAKAYYHIISSIASESTNQDLDVYHRLTEQLFEDQGISTHPYPVFMEDGEIPRYCLNKAGLNSVKKILVCISKHCPEVTFCPILPALVSLLLHFSEDEAQCFHSICCLVNYTCPTKRYIDQTFHTSRASCMTFGDLANRYCRGIRKLIASSHQNLFEFYSDWIMWIFADLPFTYAIRVLDVYLLEGYKVLYRVALALLSLYKVSVASRVAHVDDFRRDMKSFVQNVARHITIENLLKKAFGILLPPRNKLHYLFHANKDALIHRGIHQRHCYQCLDLGKFTSSVVTETEMRVVWAWIPERFALFNPTRLFSIKEHGRSLSTLYSQVEDHKPTVLLLRTADEEVCGAFLAAQWVGQKNHSGEELSFYGTGECFVFTLRPGMERYQRDLTLISGTLNNAESPKKQQDAPSATCPLGYLQNHQSIRRHPGGCKFNSMILAGDEKKFIIGGNGGSALCLQADLTEAYTERCDTFESPPLCRGHFKIQSLEVWGIQSP